jgi:hypothetical protein
MVLRETLVDADIPRRDKMRESIMKQWEASFEALIAEISVRVCLLTLLALVLTNFNQ